MAKAADSIASEVSTRARGLQLFLKRIEGSYSAGVLAAKDVERVYAGAFLEFHAYVERAIERLFVGLLRGRLVSASGTVRPLISVSSDRTAYAVVSSERPYADWLPYKRFTIRRAKAFFASGRPFTLLESHEKRVLEESVLIRNALAHQSFSALRQFRRELVEGKNLPPSQHRPAAYLRGTHTIGTTRMENLLARIAVTIGKLCV